MKRILIPIVGQGSIASIIRTGLLDSMRSFCIPVVCILWNQEDLIEELKAKGFEVHLMPKLKYSDAYVSLRTMINFAYQICVLKTPSIKYEYAYKKHFLKRRKRLSNVKTKAKNWCAFKLKPRLFSSLREQEVATIQMEPVYEDYKKWITDVNVDGIYTVAPFLPEIELTGRLLKKENKLLLAAIHSFDNITKRPWPAIQFDKYSVWNKYNKNELLRIYSNMNAQDIYINGAPQFDFHFDAAFLMEKEAWKKMLGIKSDRKIILYAGGWKGATPHEDQYVQNIMEGIHNGTIEGEPLLLLRGHPLDTLDRWKNVKEKYPEIVFDILKQGNEKFDFVNLTSIDITRSCSTLHYCDVHINLVSTMAIDGAAHNRPQIGPYYDNVKAERDLRNLYKQEHYVPVIESGALKLAGNKKEFLQLINDALQHPDDFTTKHQQLLLDIVSFSDGKSTFRVIEFLKKYLT
jgi:hypothetical protein